MKKQSIVEKLKKFMSYVGVIVFLLLVNGQVALAAPTPTPTPTTTTSTLQSSPLYTGTTKLIADGTAALTGISAAVTCIILIYLFMKAQGADDEGDAKVIKKKMKKVAIYGIAITLVSGTFSILVGYYS